MFIFSRILVIYIHIFLISFLFSSYMLNKLITAGLLVGTSLVGVAQSRDVRQSEYPQIELPLAPSLPNNVIVHSLEYTDKGKELSFGVKGATLEHCFTKNRSVMLDSAHTVESYAITSESNVVHEIYSFVFEGDAQHPCALYIFPFDGCDSTTSKDNPLIDPLPEGVSQSWYKVFINGVAKSR